MKSTGLAFAKAVKHHRTMKRDINQSAAHIVSIATGEAVTDGGREKNEAAVALGRLGGLKGGRARAAKLSEAQRREIASNAARKRWAKPS